MNPRQYEEFCAQWWEDGHPSEKAVVTEKDSYGGDGGIDIVITTQTGTKLGQCKHYQEGGGHLERTPVKDIRAFKGVMAREGVENGVFFSSLKFSQKSWREAKLDNIWLEYLTEPEG